MTTNAPQAEADGVYVGAYRLQNLLGTGSFGKVYLAYQSFLDRLVAVKLINSDLSTDYSEAQFMQEARTIAKLRHPNIVNVYEFGTAPQDAKPLAYMVMEYLPGETLRSMLKRSSLPTVQVVEITEQLASALDYAHARGIIHRDLKPANIMFSDENQPVIVDFGLAKLVEISRRGAAGEEHAATTSGTPAYMSPEQAIGRPVGPASDQYSLALMAYQMLGQRMPFNGTSMSEIIRAKLDDAPLPLSNTDTKFPPTVDEVFQRALASTPAARYITSSDFARALSEALLPDRKSQVMKVIDPVQAAQLRSARQTVLGFIWGLMLVTAGVMLFSLSLFLRGYLSTSSTFVWDGIVASTSMRGDYHDVIGVWPDGPAERAGILPGDQFKTDIYYDSTIRNGDFSINGRPRSEYPENWMAQEGDLIERDILRDGQTVHISYRLERSPFNLFLLLSQMPPAIIGFACAGWLLRRWGAEPGVIVIVMVLMAGSFALVASGVTNQLPNIDSLGVFILLPLLLHFTLIFPEPFRINGATAWPRYLWLIYLPIPIGLFEFIWGQPVFDQFNLVIYGVYALLLVAISIFKWLRHDLKRYPPLRLLLLTWLIVSGVVLLSQAIVVFDSYDTVQALWGGNGLTLLAVEFGIISIGSSFAMIIATIGTHRIQHGIGRTILPDLTLEDDSMRTLIMAQQNDPGNNEETLRRVS